MRFSLATASLAVSVALLAGCSASQGTQSLPSSSVGAQSIIGSVPHPDMRKFHHITPMQLLKMQADGKIAGPLPQAVLRKHFKQLQGHSRPHFAVGHAVSAQIWASNTDEDYLIGLNKKGKKAVATINVESNGCEDPITVKVDASQNIWTACEFNDEDAMEQQEYSSNGTLENTYSTGCPVGTNPSNCTWYFSEGFDGGEDASGNVFSGMVFFEADINSVFEDGTGFEYANSPSAQPTLLTPPPSSGVEEIYYMDVDNSDNIWFDYYGSNGSGYGYFLGEVQNATTSPTWVTGIAALGFAGGVYVGGAGSTLSVIDQDARTISRYSLPGFGALSTLGPTKANLFGNGDPVAGGYNSTGASMAIGDAYGWLDLGNVSANKWKTAQNINLGEPEGAAYTPSDK
jgi:hypothetical protein